MPRCRPTLGRTLLQLPPQATSLACCTCVLAGRGSRGRAALKAKRWRRRPSPSPSPAPPCTRQPLAGAHDAHARANAPNWTRSRAQRDERRTPSPTERVSCACRMGAGFAPPHPHAGCCGSSSPAGRTLHCAAPGADAVQAAECARPLGTRARSRCSAAAATTTAESISGCAACRNQRRHA